MSWLYLVYKKVKWSRYRPGVALRIGRGVALLFHDHGTRRWWVVRSTPQQHFTPGKDPVPILQEAEWAPGPVWMDGKSCPHWHSIPDRPACSQSLYRLSYPAHLPCVYLHLFGVFSYCPQHDSNDSGNSLAKNIINYLNIILQEIFDITYFKFCCLLNIPHKITPQDLMEWKNHTKLISKYPFSKVWGLYS